jgi:nucleoside-diphosphate-sugar epimerase
MDGVLTNIFGVEARRYRSRVEAIAADVTDPGFGLPADRLVQLARRVSRIVHCAASVSFTLPLAQARAINVGGTLRMLDFAELASANGGLERYAHISTAYVAGTHTGRFAERDLDVGQRFNNSYEQSKFEAEQLVRARSGLPFTILRPSIVVGDRHSGWTAAFNVLYWPLRAFARGLFTEVPAVPSAPVDVVSIDYVADAVLALCDSPAGVGETYHITAGAQASTMGEIAQLASRYFRRPLRLSSGAARPSEPQSTAASRTSRTSPRERCLTTRPLASGSSRWGSVPRRCVTTSSGCSTSRRCADGVSARSPASTPLRSDHGGYLTRLVRRTRGCERRGA